jgi:molybdopterin converting factor small subunit
VEVRIRLGSGLARLAAAPSLTVELADGATVADLRAQLAVAHPELAPALRSALPVVHGDHVDPQRPLRHGEEIALLVPVSGG